MNESSLAEISNDLHIARLGIDGNIYFYCVQYTVVYSFQTQLKRVNFRGFGYISIKRQVI